MEDGRGEGGWGGKAAGEEGRGREGFGKRRRRGGCGEGMARCARKESGDVQGEIPTHYIKSPHTIQSPQTFYKNITQCTKMEGRMTQHGPT